MTLFSAYLSFVVIKDNMLIWYEFWDDSEAIYNIYYLLYPTGWGIITNNLKKALTEKLLILNIIYFKAFGVKLKHRLFFC